MSIQTVTQQLTIEWDDSVVMIFSLTFNQSKIFCGFLHQVLATQTVVGNQVQVSAILQTLTQQGVQTSQDPQTWVETVKNGARSGTATVVFDDSTSVPYTTQTNLSFNLQTLFSITG